MAPLQCMWTPLIVMVVNWSDFGLCCSCPGNTIGLFSKFMRRSSKSGSEATVAKVPTAVETATGTKKPRVTPTVLWLQKAKGTSEED